MGVPFPFVSNDDEEEGTEVDVHVDMPSLITASVETASPSVRPADDEPSTSPFALRAPVTKHRTGPQLPVGVGRPSPDEASDDSSVSLLTPRFDSNELAKKIAFAEAIAARENEDEEDEVGTTRRPPVRELEEATLERRAPRDADDERTLDAPAAATQLGAIAGVPMVGPEPGGEEETTTSRREPARGPSEYEEPPEDDSRDEATPGHPPMRPRYDSEAAAQWPPWHAQPEEARAALRGVISPVASGTEIMPRSTVEDAFRMLASGQTNHTNQASQLPHLPPRPDPFAPDPLAHRLEAPPPQPTTLPGPGLPAPSASARGAQSTPSGRVKRGVSPFAVFVFAFLFTGGIFGGLIASRSIPLFAVAPTASAPADPPVASGAASAESAPEPSESMPSAAATSAAAPGASASAAASTTTVASASASGAASTTTAASASASAAPATTRPKTKSGPRRGKPR